MLKTLICLFSHLKTTENEILTMLDDMLEFKKKYISI
jgi:hypothetical protein